jgi:4-amino-4-deoxy-L-arabinose transferase-like glycosyltransferase
MRLAARTSASARARARTRRPPSPGSISTQTWILLAITAVAAAARWATIADQSYWLDESQAAHELALSFGSMLHAWRRFEGNPPLYFIVAWPWARIFGTGAAGLRSLSALAGVALVPLLYLAGRELVSARAGLIAAALAAVNPFLIWYSQEAREYMLLGTLSAASLLFFARAWRRRSSRDLAWWALFSALALGSQYFAGFLVAAEAVILLLAIRTRACLAAVAAVGVVEAALIPHAVAQGSAPLAFIAGEPLSQRVAQVPVTFGMGQLYQSPVVSYGLIGAAALAALVLVLLMAGAEDRELRGAGIAAALAATVILVPLALAVAGRDDFISRALIPAWPPLAIVIGAACGAWRTRVAGAALAVALLAMFVWAGAKVQSTPLYQRPDWRAVAAALGPARVTRAIVAYDGEAASGPLSLYLPRVPWAGPGGLLSPRPATIAELDVVGSPYDERGPVSGGVRLLVAATVDGYEVARFALPAPWHATAAQMIDRASALLAPALPGTAVVIQRGSA